MKQRVLTMMAGVALLTGGLAAPALSDIPTVAVYEARLGTGDHFNSRGVRLTDAYDIIRQDRANYHKFGVRDPDDQGETVFVDPGARALIPAGIKRGCCPLDARERAAVLNGTPKIKVWVSWDGAKYYITVEFLEY